MNRRALLRELLVAPFLTQAVLQEAAKALAAPVLSPLPLIPTPPSLALAGPAEWVIKEFDFGNIIGIALKTTIGETDVRNGVRLFACRKCRHQPVRGLCEGWMDEFGAFPCIHERRLCEHEVPAVRTARQLLNFWLEEHHGLTLDARNVGQSRFEPVITTPGVRDDEVLEGQEMPYVGWSPAIGRACFAAPLGSGMREK